MAERVVEGSWEEVSRLAAEFTGCRVRVTVLDEPARALTLDRALAPLLIEAEALRCQLPAMNEPVPSDEWGKAVADKFRHQGFIL